MFFTQMQAKRYKEQRYMPRNKAKAKETNLPASLKCLNRILVPTYINHWINLQYADICAAVVEEATFDPRTCKTEPSGRHKQQYIVEKRMYLLTAAAPIC